MFVEGADVTLPTNDFERCRTSQTSNIKLLTEKVHENSLICIDPGLNNGPKIHRCLHRTCKKASVIDNVRNHPPPCLDCGGYKSHFSQSEGGCWSEGQLSGMSSDG